MKHAKGERLNIRFNRKIKLEFHGARLTSDEKIEISFLCLKKIPLDFPLFLTVNNLE